MAVCPICSGTDCVPTGDRTRAEPFVSVLECQTCSHAFLEDFTHIDDTYFSRSQFLKSKGEIATDIANRARHFATETADRVRRLSRIVANRRLLDVGCGSGEFLMSIRSLCSEVSGIERTAVFISHGQERDIAIHPAISEAPGKFDIITMFHVLEHFADPVGVLRDCLAKLAPDGIVYVEVPNRNDALLTLFESKEYRARYFFHDHLQYFCRHSLDLAGAKAGAKARRISGHSRFGLANHLHWLVKAKPQGHVRWSDIETESLRDAYAEALARVELSDSLVAVFSAES